MNRSYFEGFIAQRGVTKKAIAQALGVTAQTVYNFLNGKKRLTMEEAYRLRVFLRMTDAEFKRAFEDEPWYEIHWRLQK